ncbi:hypothetical protein PGQ11_014998 [Apiospora arundinis]|uniref:Uncharacterized protein n=1 Tax=Apiospora arundinis TaxID=335852 RepID=A0ABR2HKQ3_9PEZI
MSVAVQYPFPGMHSPTTASSKPVLPPAYHSPRDFEKLAAMQAAQSPQQQQQHTSYNGRPNIPSSKFDSHDDFYDFLDSNRGGNGGGPPPQSQTAGRPSSINSNNTNPNNNNMAMGGSPNVQRPIPINGPDQQSRPPVTRGAGGAQMRSRPPSYGSGSRSEEMLVDKHREQRERERRQQQAREQQQAQMQQASPGGPPSINNSARKPLPGGPRSPSSDSPSHNAPWRAGSGAHAPQQQQARPTSSDSVSSDGLRPNGASNNQNAMGAAIQRLKSPSVADCVLSPLESKVTEYMGFMNQEEDTISRLDAEISLLQARKAEAEARHAEAKSKHDDYRRQYADVERALRGDAPPMPGMRHAATATPGGNIVAPQTQHQAPQATGNGPTTTRELQQMQQQQNGGPMMGRPSVHNPQHDDREMDDMDEDDYDDEDEYQNRRPGSRRIMSQQSFGRASQQGKKSRFRFSLFGGDK